MKLYLSAGCALKLLENPCVYHIASDELYEVDGEAFEFLSACAGDGGGESSDSDAEFIEFCMSEGILKDTQQTVQRPPLKQSPLPSLRYLELQITSKCNLRCRHCYVDPAPGLELEPLAIRDILSEFEGMQGLRLLITGGEPLLHSCFDEVNASLDGLALRKILFTNGLLLSEEKLSSLNFEEIQISIDGMEAAHDSIRGKGTYRKSMDAIEMAMVKGLEVSVSTMVHTGNLKDFETMDKLFRGLGVRDWTVDVPCVSGRLRENPDLSLPPEIAGKYLNYGFGGGLHGGGEGGACGLHLMSVTAEGTCAKCAFYTHAPLGIITDGLEACWSRLKNTSISELQCDCDVRDLCRGGCRYRAELLGSPLGKDLYKCAAYGKIK